MDTTQYLLDTNICVFFLRGKYDIPKELLRVGLSNCHISEITVAELLYGAECSSCPAQNIDLVLRFCSAIDVIPMSACLRQYARQKAFLRKQGLLVDDFDLLIGATAIASDMILVSDNTKHFKRLPVLLENWIQR